MTAVKQRELTGRMVLMIFIGFFLTIFAANGIMTYVAVGTFSGVETEDAYRKGRDYNTTLAAARAQEALSWQAGLNTVALGGNRLALGVDVSKKAGTALEGAKVEVVLMRPTAKGMDINLTLQESTTGQFASEVTLPAAGNWKAIVTVTAQTGETYRLERKLLVEG